MKRRVLMVDDDRQFVEDILFHLGERFDWETRNDGRDLLEVVRETLPDVILLDIDLGDGPNGLDILGRLRADEPGTPVIMVTRHDSEEMSAKALHLGALGYIEKGCRVDQLAAQLERAIDKALLGRENTALREEVQRRAGRMVGRSGAMLDLFGEIDRVAKTPSTVLITGETGTGKELVAREIHDRSPRSGQLFVPICCPAIPSEIIESELFGHEKGAFTGASHRKLGKFELAHRGTLFLDEISELSPAVQAKLLRVLQDHRVSRVGGGKEIEVDVRIVAATNKDLASMVEQGSFRQDLFYRLRVVPIVVPPLRERKEDLPLLVEALLERKCSDMGRTRPSLDDRAMDLLVAWDWPGNVRELENVLENALVHGRGGVLEENLFAHLIGGGLTRLSYAEAKKRAMERFERDYLGHVLRSCEGNVSEVARRMEMSRQGVQKMMKRLGFARTGDSPRIE